jgi:hypothetical protein
LQRRRVAALVERVGDAIERLLLSDCEWLE